MNSSRAAHARNLIGPLVRSTYRIDVRHVENVPKSGPVLIWCSWNNIAAPSVLKAAIPRPVHVWTAGAAALPGPLLSVTGDLAMPEGRPGVGVVARVVELLENGEAVAAIGVQDAGYIAAKTGTPIMTASVLAPATKRPTDPPARKSAIVVSLGALHSLPDRVISKRPTRSAVRTAGEWIRQVVVDEAETR